MKTYQKIIAGVVSVIVVLLVIGSVVTTQDNNIALGGLIDDPFTYKNTSSSASSTATVAVMYRGGAGVLGNVTILTTSAHTIKLYDGASASATSSATLIGAFPASAVVGTYNFNVAFTKGLIVETQSAYAGSAVVTFK
jgi:hypothetical protein